MLALLAACGPSLVTDDVASGSKGGEASGDAPSPGTSDDGDEPPDPSAPGDDTSIPFDVGAPGSDGASQLDAGPPGGVCTDAACFGPATTLDETPAHAVAIVDLDGDGVAELVAGTDAGLRVYTVRGGVAVGTTTIDTFGGVVALTSGALDGDAAGDLVAVTDAARVVVVRGGRTPTVTTLAASDGLEDVAIAPGDGSSPTFATVSRGGTLSWWQLQGQSWVPSFFQLDARPTTLAIGASQGSPARIVAVGDDTGSRLDVLAIEGTMATDAAEYPFFDNDPLQLEIGPLGFGALPELLVLGDDPPALEIHGFVDGLDSLGIAAVLPLAGKPVAFATGVLGYGQRDVAVVDATAGTVELCAFVVQGEYQPSCPGAVIPVGAEPVAIAIGELEGGGPEEIAIASPSAGVVLVAAP